MSYSDAIVLLSFDFTKCLILKALVSAAVCVYDAVTINRKSLATNVDQKCLENTKVCRRISTDECVRT